MSRRNNRTQTHRGRAWDVWSFVFSIMADALLVLIAFAFAYWIRFNSGLFSGIKEVPSFSYYICGSLFVVVVWLFAFYFLGLYDQRRKLTLLDESFEVFKGSVIGTFIALFPTFFFRTFTYSRLVLLIACFLAIAFILLGKAGFHLFKVFGYKRGFGLKRVAIVGGGEMGGTILERIKKRSELGYHVVGQILENSKGRIDTIPSLGRLEDIREIVDTNNIDTLIMTFPLRSHHKVAMILSECEDLHVDFQFVPDMYELMTSKVSLYEIEGIPLIALKESSFGRWEMLLKRALDLALSLSLLAAFGPLMVMIAIIIKLASRGPVLFWQKRTGLEGKTFTLCKFRTMHAGSEKFDELAGLGTEDDPRITKIGAVLRKTSMDELPQLLNVIRGDMSLVGPRPERVFFVEKFQGEVSRYVERHKIKPGITGWAQVNGLRGDTSLEERIRHDLYYIENWSLGFDLKIIVKTAFIMCRRFT